MSQIYATGASGGGGTAFSGRVGSVPLTNGTTSQAVTFASALSAATYALIATISNVVDGTPQFQSVVPTTISVGGFTATWNGGLDSGNYVLNYIAQPTDSSATSQAGTATVASGATSKSITFGTPMTDTNFSIQVGFVNVTDPTPQFQTVTPTAISTTGFTATWNSDLDSANYVLHYIVTENT